MGEPPRKPRYTLRRTINLLFAVVMTPAALIALVMVRLMMFPVPPGPPKKTPAAIGLPFESFEARTADGIAVRGWYVPSAAPARTRILHDFL